MTGAIILVVTIIIVGIALFFVIRKLSSVDDSTSDVSYEEASITDFQVTEPDADTDQDLATEPNNFQLQLTRIMKKLSSIIQTIWHMIEQGVAKGKEIIDSQVQKRQEQQRQARIEQDRLAREAVEREEQEHQLEQKMADEESELDTSHLENVPRASTRPKPARETQAPVKEKTHSESPVVPEVDMVDDTPDTPTEPKKEEPQADKADTFVEQLMSEDDSLDPTEQESDQSDISDSYYYSYMEKRYINKIVKNPRDVASYKKLGELYVEMKNYEDAYASFQIVLKIKPDDTAATRRMQELKKLLG